MELSLDFVATYSRVSALSTYRTANVYLAGGNCQQAVALLREVLVYTQKMHSESDLLCPSSMLSVLQNLHPLRTSRD